MLHYIITYETLDILQLSHNVQINTSEHRQENFRYISASTSAETCAYNNIIMFTHI